VKKSIIPT